METVTDSIESLIEKTEIYSQTSIELAKLKALDTTTNVVTTMISRISVIALISLSVLVFNIGVALLLGDLLGKTFYGFFIVGAFYMVAAVFAHFLLSHWIKKPFSNLIITQALQQEMPWEK
jgi:hypothetical protein